MDVSNSMVPERHVSYTKLINSDLRKQVLLLIEVLTCPWIFIDDTMHQQIRNLPKYILYITNTMLVVWYYEGRTPPGNFLTHHTSSLFITIAGCLENGLTSEANNYDELGGSSAKADCCYEGAMYFVGGEENWSPLIWLHNNTKQNVQRGILFHEVFVISINKAYVDTVSIIFLFFFTRTTADKFLYILKKKC